jgi:general secretion pathway protein A
LRHPVPTPAQDPPLYEQYYGLAQSPFTLSPDPQFLFLSESHDEALRSLLHALRRREGFIVLAGDIGTGKTTLCRALVERLDRTTFTSLIRNPFVTVEDLLRDVLLDFGIVSRDAARNGRLATATRHELIATLHEFLRSLAPLQGRCVLIIDEAQHLSNDVLEQIRIVANLETNDARLLHIVLVGQLDLLDTLAAADMRQLAQRVSLRARLNPLTAAAVAGYVAHRLAVAGAPAAVAFEPAALAAVHRISGGVPRVINLLCDRALTVGASRGAAAIDAAAVRDAARLLDLAIPDEVTVEQGAGVTAGDEVAVPPPRRRRTLAIGVTLILTLAAAAALLENFRVAPPPSPPAPRFSLRLPAAIEPLPVPEPLPAPIRRRLVPIEPPREAPPADPGAALPPL